MAQLKLSKIVYNNNFEENVKMSPVISLFVDACTESDLTLNTKKDFVLKLGKSTRNNLLSYHIYNLDYNVRAYSKKFPINKLSLQVDKNGNVCYFDTNTFDNSLLSGKFVTQITEDLTFAINLDFTEEMKYGDYLLINDSKYIYCLWYGEENDKIIPLDPQYFNMDYKITNEKETIIEVLKSIGAVVYENESNICYSFPILYKPDLKYFIKERMTKAEKCNYTLYNKGNNDRLVQISNQDRHFRIWTQQGRDINDITISLNLLYDNIYLLKIDVENNFGLFSETFTDTLQEIERLVNDSSEIINIQFDVYENIIEGEFKLGFNDENIIYRDEINFLPYETTFMEIKTDYPIINRDCILVSEYRINNVKYNFITNGTIDGFPLIYYYLILFRKGKFTGLIDSKNITVVENTDRQVNVIYFDKIKHYLETSKVVNNKNEIVNLSRVFINELLLKFISEYVDRVDELVPRCKELFPFIIDIKITVEENLSSEMSTYNIELIYSLYEKNETVLMTLELIRK